MPWRTASHEEGDITSISLIRPQRFRKSSDVVQLVSGIHRL